jgi:excisionase family DNA binding protein
MFLNVKEVAAFLKLSVMTIRRYTMNKKIPFHKINRSVRYDKSEIEAWVRNGGISKQIELPVANDACIMRGFNDGH